MTTTHSSNVAAGFIPLIFVLLLIVLTFVYYRRSGLKAGSRVIVRCREGHLFTTIWMPLGSFKAVRLGPIRYQYCPTGQNWTFVRQVDESTLTEEELNYARDHHDNLIP